MSKTQHITLCQLEDIPDGKARGFELGPDELDRILVVRRGEKVCAYKDICPHYGETTLPWRKDEYLDSAGTFIVCAAHGALFDIESGECISGPCLGDHLTPVDIELNENQQLIAVISNDASE